MTVADIGTNEREMEYVLGEWFQRCTDWGAIILIDEADADPLVGMGLLDGCELRIQVRPGGKVTITSLP